MWDKWSIAVWFCNWARSNGVKKVIVKDSVANVKRNLKSFVPSHNNGDFEETYIKCWNGHCPQNAFSIQQKGAVKDLDISERLKRIGHMWKTWNLDIIERLKRLGNKMVVSFSKFIYFWKKFSMSYTIFFSMNSWWGMNFFVVFGLLQLCRLVVF